MSIGGYGVWPEIETAIREYQGLFVCSTGNKEKNNDIAGKHHYPSFYGSDMHTNPLQNMITVGRSDINDSKPTGANWGNRTIMLFAPGEHILSTYPEEFGGITVGYRYLSGSSMATPQVSGVAALLLSINPNLTTQQLRTAILESVDIPNVDGENPLEDLCVTDGRLNAYNAVKYVLSNYGSSTTLKYNTKTLSKTTNSSSTFFNEKNYFLKMNVENAYEYDFIISSSSALEVTLYDSNFNEINVSQASTNGGLTKTFSYYLSVGTYYLQSNYVSSTVSSTINVSIVGEPHTHSYNHSYSWVSYTNHYGYCHCDEFQLQGHAVASGSYNTGQRFATCLLCGGRAEMGFVQLTINSSTVTKVTINGSFILPNGVIILEDEDLEAYLNGTLVFYDKDKVPVIQ